MPGRAVRVVPIDYASASPVVRAAHDAHIANVATMTNMKRTLLRSLPAFKALMMWYDLRDTVRPFLGERLTVLFAHAISTATDCLICSTFFRRILIESGQNPDQLTLDPREQAVVAYGQALSQSPFVVSDATFSTLRTWFNEPEIVALTAFGALMVATNVVNNALEVPLDGYLEPFRAGV